MLFHVWHVVCRGETTQQNRQNNVSDPNSTSLGYKEGQNEAMGMRVDCIFLLGVLRMAH